MNYGNIIVAAAIFFIILVSIQYSLNKIIVLLKEINEALQRIENSRFK